MIKRIFSVFKRRRAEDQAQDILQEIMQHLARRQAEIDRAKGP